MTSAILALALFAQCPGGSCSLPAATYYPQFTVPQVQAPQPQLWQLADRTGQRWTHRDPAYLRAWVAHRNGLILTTPAGGR